MTQHDFTLFWQGASIRCRNLPVDSSSAMPPTATNLLRAVLDGNSCTVELENGQAEALELLRFLKNNGCIKIPPSTFTSSILASLVVIFIVLTGGLAGFLLLSANVRDLFGNNRRVNAAMKQLESPDVTEQTKIEPQVQNPDQPQELKLLNPELSDLKQPESQGQEIVQGEVVISAKNPAEAESDVEEWNKSLRGIISYDHLFKK
jgi:hypothetical protein